MDLPGTAFLAADYVAAEHLRVEARPRKNKSAPLA
jgi:hypothetical protein